jgi:HAD superfamily hydrolase (TIGR01509 family)
MLKAVIFDMDGVIIDSEPFHWEVNKKNFYTLGIEVPEKEYENYIGVSNVNMWTEIKKKHGLLQPVEQLVNMQVSGNIDFMKRERFDPIDGVIDFIVELKSRNTALAIASSSPNIIIGMVLNGFGIKKYFDVIVSGEDFENGKPAPDIFLKAASLLKISPEQCIVIEDSTHGVDAARAAGMKCLGFSNKNSLNQDLKNADSVFKTFRDLSVKAILRLDEPS